MTRKAARLIAGLLLGVSVFLAPFLVQRLNAQVLYGSVTGTVTDASGAVVPGAQVTITNDATGLKRQTTAESTGLYRILDLPEGTYTLEVTASGFKPLKKTSINVVIGQVNLQDFQLAVGGLTQEVTVQGSVVELQTQKADVHTTVSSFAVENLPTDMYRNFQTISLLAPGVFSDSQITHSYPNSYTDTPERSLNIDSNGLPPRINTTRVDGATDLFIWLPNHMLVIPPQDTIEEVNVQTQNYDVEKGLTAGVATDVVTKSGTNLFHGTLYGFHSDNAMDASNVYWPGTLPKSKHILNQDGGTIGGPIKKNKLFFFANWDGLFERNNYSTEATIPPVAVGSSISNWRAGDFSSALGVPLYNANGTPINVCTTEGATVQLQEGMVFDPTSGNPDGTNRCVFSSGGQLNVIPTSRLNTGATNFLSLVPTPNYYPQGNIFNVYTTANYFISTVDKDTRNIFTGKIDFNRTDKHTIWGKWTGQDFNSVDPPWYGAAGGGYATGHGHQFAQTMTIGHSWTLSPTMVLTGHVGFTRMAENSIPPTYGKPLGETVLGIPGSNAPDGNPLYTGMPGIAISGFSTMGDANSWEPVHRNDWTLTTSHNITMIHGNHELRFGVDVAHNHLNHFQPEIFCCPRGYVYDWQGATSPDMPIDAQYDQLPVYTETNGTLTNTGPFATAQQNALALFELGMTSETTKSQQIIKNTAKDTQFGLYAGDRWKITPKFTADVGVRYEYFPLITRDGEDKFELYNPNTDVLELGGLGGNPVHLGVTTSKLLFTPRVGLAYRLNDKMVVRSGFGISNDTMPLERPLRGFYPLSIGSANALPSTLYSWYQPYGTFAEGIPLIQIPNLSSGSVTPPPTDTVGTLGPGEFKRGYVESWNFFLQRQLPGQFLLDVGYVGNHLVHEMNGRDLNAATLGGTSASQPLYTQFGVYAGGSYQFQGYLDSHYDGLQISVNRHFYQGLYLQGSYTYSKAIDYVDDNSWENGLWFNCPPSPSMPQGCQGLNRGTASFDHTHMLKMAYVYELPMGGGKRWANNNKTAKAILGGWRLTGIFSAWTGAPLGLQGDGPYLHTPDSVMTANEVPGVALHSGFPTTGTATSVPAKCPYGQGPGQCWFNPSAFVPDLTPNTFGTVGRQPSWLRAPGLVQMDQSLFREFKLSERFHMEARFETQNLTNSPHFYGPNAYCTDVLGTCGGGFGQISSGYGERYVQIGLKVKF